MAEAFQPADPNFRAKIAKSFARQPFMAFLGVELAAVDPGRVVLKLPRRLELTQQHGFLHGGVVATIADVAGGYAGNSLMGADDSVLTVEFKINLVAPAQGDGLIARGEVLRAGRTLTITRTDVFALQEGREILCATALQTLMRMAGRPERDPA